MAALPRSSQLSESIASCTLSASSRACPAAGVVSAAALYRSCGRLVGRDVSSQGVASTDTEERGTAWDCFSDGGS